MTNLQSLTSWAISAVEYLNESHLSRYVTFSYDGEAAVGDLFLIASPILKVVIAPLLFIKNHIYLYW